MSKVFEAEHIKKSFKFGENVITVLDDISFSIEAGEYIIFFGPSGCGKSTLLNVISGLETIDEGKVKLRGDDLAKYTSSEMAQYRRTKIGIVFQSFNLLKSLTNEQNVAMPLLANGEPLARSLNRATQLLTMVGLGKHIDKKPTELSGGQQQRVAIARALAANPWIIIADEPTGNLDSKSAEELIEIINILNRKSKRTVIMVTHNPDYLKYADRVIYLRDGKIVDQKKNAHPPAPKQIEGFNLSDRAVAKDSEKESKPEKEPEEEPKEEQEPEVEAKSEEKPEGESKDKR